MPALTRRFRSSSGVASAVEPISSSVAGLTFSNVNPDEAAVRVYNFLHTLAIECQMMARACGKTNVHSLEPEDLAALTMEASAMAEVPRHAFVAARQKDAAYEKSSRTTRFSMQNSQKAYRGYQAGVMEARLMAQKTDNEADFRKRVSNDPVLKNSYGDVWDKISRIAEEQRRRQKMAGE